jgi:ornithine carbamoyltransferase
MNKDIKHFINLMEIDPDEVKEILKLAHRLKAQKYSPPQLLKGMSLAMVFDKLSTRTRVSFEIAMKQLGGHTVVMSKGDMQLGGAESTESTAKTLSRFVDAIMVRMSEHDKLQELASNASIPVINGMTDNSHPCQLMADMMTIEEKMDTIQGKKVAWFGDYNNVSQSYIDCSKIFDFDFMMALPEHLNGNVPKGVAFSNDPKEAAKNADVFVTDTWVSLGQEGKEIEAFWPYQVNSELMALGNDDAIFMHCLPMHEWEEVSEEVAKSSASVIYDEAENRLHAQKAVLAWCLENSGVQI